MVVYMNETLRHPPTYVKAIWAGVTAFGGSLLVALTTLQSSGVEPVNPGQLGWIEWLVIVLTTMAAFGGVYGLKNAAVGPSQTALKGSTPAPESAPAPEKTPPYPDLEP